MHRLKGVDDVHFVVVWVLGRVAFIQFLAQLVASLHGKVKFAVEIVELANFVHDE
jgi:hypothetical protein